jgi:hypothetical protein
MSEETNTTGKDQAPDEAVRTGVVGTVAEMAMSAGVVPAAKLTGEQIKQKLMDRQPKPEPPKPAPDRE